MMEITSMNNSLIKEIRALYRKKERNKAKLFIIEGIKIVEEAIDTNYPIDKIIFSESLLDNKEGRDFLQRIKNSPNLIKTSEKVFNSISDTENPQGILALGKFQQRNIIEITNKNKLFMLLLDEVQDPGNMGTIIRTVDAFNMDGIIITEGTVDFYNPKVVRSTMGSIFRVPLYYIDDVVKELKQMQEQGIYIYSTSLDESSYINEIEFNPKSILVIGNESKGVRDSISNLANKKIKIPMPGLAESLNAGVAASIIMYEAMKQQFNKS